MYNKKHLFGILTTLSLLTLSTTLLAAPNQPSQPNRPAAANNSNNPNRNADQNQAYPNEAGKYEILRRNQWDDTDTLAIPFDDSEVEDEEEINRAEKKRVFNLPQRR